MGNLNKFGEPKKVSIYMGRYKGTAEWDDLECTYLGSINNVSHGVFHFTGKDLDSLKKNFSKMVSSYIRYCNLKGICTGVKDKPKKSE